MTPVIAFLLLLLALIAWLSIPFIPAIFELLHPRDAVPLSGVGTDSGELTWFADGFRRYARSMGLFDELYSRFGEPLGPELREPDRAEPMTNFELPDGSSVRVLRSARLARELLLLPGRPRSGDRVPDLRDILVVDVASPLPEYLAVDRELLARSDFTSGPHVRLRALLAQQNALLAEYTTILRWVHAEGLLTAAAGSRLFGRATSDTGIRLSPGVEFERMLAPRILVGEEADFVPPAIAGDMQVSQWVPDKRLHVVQMSADTIRVEGDLIVPPGVVVSGNLVIVGALVLERGAQVHGNVKAIKGIQLVGENIVSGAMTAREDIHVGERSRISGPLIGEQTVHVHANAFIGTPHLPTTISAPRIILTRGATVFGAVAAREMGRTE